MHKDIKAHLVLDWEHLAAQGQQQHFVPNASSDDSWW